MTERSKERKTVWVECGRIGRPIGLRGDCAVFWNNDRAPVTIGGELFLEMPGEGGRRSCIVAALRRQGRSHVVRFEGVDDRDGAAALTHARLLLPADRLPALPAGEYYAYELIGLAVVTEEGRELGCIVKIFTAGENDVYEVRDDAGHEHLVPAIKDVIRDIDLEEGRVTIRPLEGMLEG